MQLTKFSTVLDPLSFMKIIDAPLGGGQELLIQEPGSDGFIIIDIRDTREGALVENMKNAIAEYEFKKGGRRFTQRIPRQEIVTDSGKGGVPNVIA